MPLPILHGRIHIVGDNRRTYIGGNYDIYPPLHRGLGYSTWYLGLRYFSVSSHVHYVDGMRIEFWHGSYIAYRFSHDNIRMAEVIQCLVDSRDGNPVVVCRRFFTVQDIGQANVQIPDFIHSSTVGRMTLRQEVFYTTDSFICHLHNVVVEQSNSQYICVSKNADVFFFKV